ncbi:winged helix-turn-helix domain-containing protein [Actinomyces culturomici]|uniref:winged helix-turn-helix domain-containing protein n=1 Tax=Actinomyces culturomici TaxID=1926276 RepID=UPI000E2002F5|nr:winged helix-turn-helix domain-containing protein [Actinomyces culturomici]
MTLVNTPATSAAVDLDAAPQTSYDEFLSILANLRLAPAHVDFDVDRGTLDIHGDRVRLCAKELDLLSHLARNADRAVSRDELFSTVWQGSGLGSDSRTVDAHIRRLRKKLEGAPDLISTVRGEGYRFNSAPGVRVQVARVHTLAA